jgi:hypothetical protein
LEPLGCVPIARYGLSLDENVLMDGHKNKKHDMAEVIDPA